MTAPAGSSLLSAWRRPARWLRRLPDRLLHPLRRRRARRTLLAHRKLAGLLVLCHGNICRSPYATAVLRRGLDAAGRHEVRVDSAGFIGPGRPPPLIALQVAARRGYDLASHLSSLVAGEALPAYDLILVMDRAQRRWLHRLAPRGHSLVLLLGDFDPLAVVTRAIPDPVSGPPELFETVYDRIDRCVAALLNALQGGITSAACRSASPSRAGNST
jgi:protein-tyrosine phosphatase